MEGWQSASVCGDLKGCDELMRGTVREGRGCATGLMVVLGAWVLIAVVILKTKRKGTC